MRALLREHRELCRRAVDPLEVAAGLEAAGITDRTAARYRHRDVFALAEEMYARRPHRSDTEPEPAPGRAPQAPGTSPRARRRARAWSARTHAKWLAAALLPGAACALTLALLWSTDGRVRLAVGAGGVLVVTAALHAALRRGPLSTRHRISSVGRVAICVLLGYALLGDALLRAALADGGTGLLHTARTFSTAIRPPEALASLTDLPWSHPSHLPHPSHLSWPHPSQMSWPRWLNWSNWSNWSHRPRWPDWAYRPDWASWSQSSHRSSSSGAAGAGASGVRHAHPAHAPALPPPALASLLALAFAVAPAACCARIFAAGVRRRVERSRAPSDFTATTRSLLCAACALFLCAVGLLLTVFAAVFDQNAGYAGAGALGGLLMLARLLAVHGFTRAPALALTVAATTEILVLAAVCAASLPGCGRPAAFVDAAVTTAGPGVAPAAACGAAALALLVYAARTLTRASAHPPTGPA